MSAPSMMIMEEDHQRFSSILDQLGRESNAKLVFLVDKAGQHLASAGDLTQVDPTALASLTAGNVAATEGVAQLVGESEFTNLFHEGRHDNMYMTVISKKIILLVIFDERSSLGLVRLRVDQTVPELAKVIDQIFARATSGKSSEPSLFAEITEDDIDALFG